MVTLGKKKSERGLPEMPVKVHGRNPCRLERPAHCATCSTHQAAGDAEAEALGTSDVLLRRRGCCKRAAAPSPACIPLSRAQTP